MTQATLVRMLSPDEGWLPCYPFTLSLTPANTMRFIAAKISIFVLIDLAHLKALFAAHGITATMVMDGISAIQVCPDPTDLAKGVFRIHELLFARIGLEFQSLKWFAAEHSRLFDAREGEVISAADAAALLASGEFMTVPDHWKNAKDCWVEQPGSQ